jgi:hypothetical protein
VDCFTGDCPQPCPVCSKKTELISKSTQLAQTDDEQLTYSTPAELAKLLMPDRDQGELDKAFSQGNQMRLAMHNKFSPFVPDTKAHVTKFDRLKPTSYNLGMKSMVEATGSYMTFDSLNKYTKKVSGSTQTWHIIGYLDESSRLIRFNDDTSAILLAEFVSLKGPVSAGKAQPGAVLTYKMTGYGTASNMGVFQVDEVVDDPKPSS